jgi:molecular chaperone GrpE
MSESVDQQNDQQNAETAQRAEELRRRIAELASAQENVLTELDELQGELADLTGEQADEAGDAGPDLRAELAAANENYRRALADFQNYQRRAAENERRAREEGRAGVVESLINVLDTFDYAMQMDPEKTTAHSVIQGVQMIRGEMIRTLGQQGFVALEPKPNDEFDPHRHEAITRETAEGIAPGHIVRVLQPGYAMRERVIRPAKVSISPDDSDNDRSGDAAAGEEA